LQQRHTSSSQSSSEAEGSSYDTDAREDNERKSIIKEELNENSRVEENNGRAE